MDIPDKLLVKAKRDALRIKTPKILEEGWSYLRHLFKNEGEYFSFLENLSQDEYEKFLYTIFFYWAHDLYRIVREKESFNIDGFMYQITLSITEYLSNGKSPKEKVRKFIGYFSSEACKKLNKAIIAHRIKNTTQLNLQFWEILYDMRNQFVHEACWFDIPDKNSPSHVFISLSKHNSIEYVVEAKIRFQEYLKFFWEAYLNYFGYKKTKIK